MASLPYECVKNYIKKQKIHNLRKNRYIILRY